MKCCICGAEVDPARGAQYSATAWACGACVVDVWTMVFARMNGLPSRSRAEFASWSCPFCQRARTRGPSFYDHIAPK